MRDRYPYITKRIPHLECRACVALPRKSRWCACGRYVHYLPTVHPKCPHEVQDFNFQPLSYTAVSTHTHPAYIIVISCVKLKACMYMCTHHKSLTRRSPLLHLLTHVGSMSTCDASPTVKVVSCVLPHTNTLVKLNVCMYTHISVKWQPTH